MARALTRDALIEEMSAQLGDQVPGVKFGFSQPIEMRVNELVAGVKSDVAVLLYGHDLDVLAEKGKAIERSLVSDSRGCRCESRLSGQYSDALDPAAPRTIGPLRNQRAVASRHGRGRRRIASGSGV